MGWLLSVRDRGGDYRDSTFLLDSLACAVFLADSGLEILDQRVAIARQALSKGDAEHIGRSVEGVIACLDLSQLSTCMVNQVAAAQREVKACQARAAR
ncbi:hypothetical protein VRRI112168_02365 [Vreelandella rituensis]|uniref:Uncharacterized protein n=1 Tax=Vreelandella rituensis TaxID=2282306 RepID=A0A368U9L4_9GAMM|nr:hypothetical protein [Halomonas rituensis]RCV93591.1 hypothetical protein DU506_00105 [Halomonas rituensis]